MIPGTPLLAILEVKDADIRAMGLLIYDGVPEDETNMGVNGYGYTPAYRKQFNAVSAYNPKKDCLISGSMHGLMTLDRRYINPASMIDLKWQEIMDPCLWVMGDYSVVIAPAPDDPIADYTPGETVRNVAKAIHKYRIFKGWKTDQLDAFNNPFNPEGEL